MSFNGTSVGLDVHALSVVAHAFDEETAQVERARLCPDYGVILDWLHRLRGPVRVAYEAGPTGFGLARALAAAQIDCVVAAPSKLIRPGGDRVKIDTRDAAHLTRLLRLGEITAVTVPDAGVEAVRDLVRAREDARADLMRVRHRLSKLLLRQGRVYSGGQAWNGVHETWLRRQRFDDSHTTAAFDHHFDAVLTALGRPSRPVGLLARDLRADGAGVVGGDRGLDAVHWVVDRRLRWSGPHGVLLEGFSGAGFDHQGRQCPLAPVVDRVGNRLIQVCTHLRETPMASAM